MISALTSLLPTFDPTSFGFAPTSSSNTGVDFGPDFLLGAITGQSQVPGATYDSSGQLISLEDKSPDAQARTAALKEAREKLKQGDTAGAREAANRVLNRNPADAIAAAYVGRSYLSEGDYREAEKYFSRAASGSDDEQIAIDLRAAQVLSKGEGAATDEIRRLLRQSGTSREGAQLATYLLDANPGNLDARLALVDFYEGLGRTSLAGAELTDALDHVAPDQQSRFVSAVEEFNQKHSEDAASFDLLAQAYLRTGRLNDAEKAFGQALALSGDNVEFQVQIKEDFAGVYLRLGKERRAAGDTDEARRLLQKGIEIFSTDAAKAELSDLELNRGLNEIRQGRLKLALEALDNARAYQPGTVDVKQKNDLVAAYESLAGRFESVGDLKSITSARYGAFILDPANDTRKRSLANAFDTYGQDLLAKEDYKGAMRQFKAALGYYSNDANYAAHLAEAQLHI